MVKGVAVRQSGERAARPRRRRRGGVNPADAFERSLETLYEAALDDARWPAATALVEKAVGANGNALIVGEGLGDDVRIYFARFLQRGENVEDEARVYFRDYHPHDEGLPRLRRLPHGKLVRARDLYSKAELRTSPAYNEGLQLLGAQDGLHVRFDGPDGLRIVWALGDPVGGDWPSDRLRLLERLLPHVHRSVLIRQALAAADALGAGLAGLLDNDRIGVVQLDRRGRVLEANGPALEILRRGDGLRDRDEALDARLPADRSRLSSLLRCALPEAWGAVPAAGSMTLGRRSGGARLGLHVMPVGDPATDFGGRRVAALVLLVDPARPPHIDAARVAAALGLSPSEGRAAALLAEGRPVAEIAAATGWQPGYVRRLLKRIYRKLGVSGQVALVPRVLALDALPRG